MSANFTIQVADYQGNALTVWDGPTQIETEAGLADRLLAIKTGRLESTGQLNRSKTFIVTIGATGEMKTYTRQGATVIDDATGLPVEPFTPVAARTEPCGVCGEDVAVNLPGRFIDEANTSHRICTDCASAVAQAA